MDDCSLSRAEIPCWVMQLPRAPSWLAVAAAVTACGEGRLTVPEPPDMEALVLAYESPQGRLDEAVLVEALLFATAHVETVRSIGIDRELLDAVRVTFEAEYEPASSALVEVDGELGRSQLGLSALSEGYLRARRVCRGWQSAPIIDSKLNGSVVLAATFTADGPDPVVWGEATECRYGFDGRRVRVGGATRDDGRALRMHIGRGLGFSDVGREPVIFDLDLDFQLDDFTARLSADFRVTALDEVEVRVPEPVIPSAEGHIIVQYWGGALVGVRASNGNFVCDTVALVCVAEDGSEVSLPGLGP